MRGLRERLGGLARRVLGVGEPPDLRRKLLHADASARHWKQRYYVLAQRLAAARREGRRRLRAAVGRHDRVHRHVLEPDVLRAHLPIRATVLWQRSSAPAAVQREREFLSVSSSYAAIVGGDEPPSERIASMQLMGLHWSVPLTRPGDAAYTARYLAKQKFPFRALTQTREVALGGIMLDIGANIGRMSIPRVILGDVQVAYCAEPEPLNYACLVRNVRENALAGLVLPDRVAIDAEDGTARMLRMRTAGGHRVVASADPGQDAVEVPCLTLDTWVSRLGVDLVQLAFVKVDAQGSELHVLRGAARVLACRHVAWQIEVDPGLLASRGVSGGELFAELARHFTHFVDLNRAATGSRVRPVGDLEAALSYVTRRHDGRTDLLLFSAEG